MGTDREGEYGAPTEQLYRYKQVFLFRQTTFLLLKN